MPPRRVAQRSGRNTVGTNRAASVPVPGRPENSKLETLRLNNQRLLDAEDAPPLNIATARRRKRNSSPCALPQADCMAGTSASVTAPVVANASERRPQKRQRRSSSTPAAPRPSQLATQLRSLRSSRSRAGSPMIDMEYVQPLRPSRLARKINSFIGNRGSDIYAHLAGPDGARTLLGELPASSVVPSAPNDTVGSQSVRKPRGRRRKAVDLTNEDAKKDLMEEWARIRQSQGTLPLAGIDGNACLAQMSLCATRKDGRTVLSMQLGATTHTPELMASQETTLDGPCIGSSTRIGSENTLPTSMDGEKPQHTGSPLPPGGRTEQPIVSDLGIEAPSTPTVDPHADEGTAGDELAVAPGARPGPELLQSLTSSPQTLSASPSREASKLPTRELGGPNSLSKDGHSVSFSEAYSLDGSSNRLESDAEFHMLDVPEIFTLPWEPVESHLYVPPSLGKLISGMREQLAIETRARRRAEELYHAELSRRISAEKTIDRLQAKVAEWQEDLSGRSAC